jgi:hypothetical protein
MLGQRGWFDAWFNSGSKVQIVPCLVIEGYNLMLDQKIKKYGLMMGRRKWFDAGSKGVV